MHPAARRMKTHRRLSSGQSGGKEKPVRHLARLAAEPSAWLAAFVTVGVIGSVLYLTLSSITF
jgi:hypothetical protein